MRKITAVITSIVILFFFTTTSFAQTIALSSKTVQTTGTLTEINCTSAGTQDKIELSMDGCKGYSVKRFDKPDRIVLDIQSAKLSLKKPVASFKSKLVKGVRYSQFDKNTVRVVLDTIGQPQYQAEEKGQKLVLYITNPVANGLTYYNAGDDATFILSGIKLMDSKNGTKKLFTEKYELSGRKYTITFPTNSAKIEDKTVKIDDSLISTIQISNDKKTKETSIALEAKDRFVYEVEDKKDVNGTVIKLMRPALPDRGDVPRGTDSEEYNPDNGDTDKDNGENSASAGDADPGDGQGTPVNSLTDVQYSLTGAGADEIGIVLSGYSSYNVMRITGPNRIVVDIPSTSAPADQKTIKVGSSLVGSIRYAQYEDDVARIVIDTVGQPQYQIEEKAGRLVIAVEKPTYKNITYISNGDWVHFILSKIKLTEDEAGQKKLYTESFDETGLSYTMTFNSSLADIGSGTIKINDSYLDTVDIVKDGSTGRTSITFNAKDKSVYNTVLRKLTNDTSITILKPFEPEDRVVVIDPGHGGPDSGASKGDLVEKALNLDLSLRLNNLLKSKGIKTYIIREDDNYVGLYERAYIANKLNAAIFLSIHNNSDSGTAKGTETLYFPSESGTCKVLADIIQKNLIATLGTVNRKTVSRPGLAVLKYTTMPAALAEIAFLDNKEDGARLRDENFRQKAAEALCNGIIEALGKIGTTSK